MGIMDRIRSRDTAASTLDFSLANRLKDLAERPEPDTPQSGAPASGDASGGPEQTVRASAAAQAASDAAGTGAQPQAATPSGAAGSSMGPRVEAGKSAVATSGDTAGRPMPSPGSGLPIPAAVEEEPVLARVERRPAPVMAATAGGNGNGVTLPAPAPAPGTAPAASASKAPPEGPGQQFLERVDGAVNRAGVAKQKATGAGWQAPPEFESIQRQFETDFRSRLDGAMAEFERRFSSQTLADDVAEQLERRIRQAAENISKEMQSQAWTMHNAVAGELRAFRDQFNQEIQERAKLLDAAALQALQLRESLEAMFPRAEQTLRLLSLSGEESAARLQAASDEFVGKLRNSHQTLSREIDAKRESLESAALGFHEDGLRLKEEMERFRAAAALAGDSLSRTAEQSIERLNAAAGEIQACVREETEKSRGAAALAGDALTRTAEQSVERLNAAAGEIQVRVREEAEKSRADAKAACELLSRTTEQSFERLNGEASEVQARAREGMEKLAAEIERRILSGGLVEKATEQIAAATRQIVEPAIERIRQAGREADSAADSAARTGERVSVQMSAARQEIESKLDHLLREQLNAVENTMSGFQRKATEELGSVVERVVEESSQQMDERLHVLLQDLFATASKQMSGAARASLGTLHDGLKGVFEPPASGAEADSGRPANEE
ncbi:MAG TPA: hypothetical protein VNJ52_02750 [Patescibacteria group bacterium]|nr:hypothetical protein [Patescibacteria group bacterium]